MIRELQSEDLEIGIVKERDDGRKIVYVRFLTDLEQFELVYSVMYQKMESQLKDCVSSMGFRIKEHDIRMQSQYLTQEQIDFLVKSVTELINGVIQSRNFQTQMIMGLDELNRQILISGV